VGHSTMKDRTAYGIFRLLNPTYQSDSSKSVDQIYFPIPSQKINEKKLKWRNAIEKFIK